MKKPKDALPEMPQMPFDDALRTILKAPPKHQAAPKTRKKSKRALNKRTK